MYESSTRHEDSYKLLAKLTFDQFQKDDQDDYSTFKSIVVRIELITPVSAVRDRGSEAKSRILLQAVPAEPW